MILIYLLIEDFILDKMPKSFINLYSNNEGFFGIGILNYIFKYLTRKVNVRSFTCSILSSNILKLEKSNMDLNISVQKIMSAHSHNSSKDSSILEKKNTVVKTFNINNTGKIFHQKMHF